MKQVYQEKNSDGWTYYIDWRFAWIPTYCQGTLVWRRRVWMTWPEKDGKIILFKDMSFYDGYRGDDQMYLTEFPYDPRKA